MCDIDVQGLRAVIDEAITKWAAGANADKPEVASPENEISEVIDEPTAPARVLPEGKRVVRTKSSGDRVYCLDEVKKTRQWVTNPEILAGLGFEPNDVVTVEDDELLKYQMGPALYKLPENA